MNIKGLDKAEVLMALYRSSRTQGVSFLGCLQREPTLEDCKRFLEKSSYVDYFFGRVIKCHLDKNYVDFRLYDRDCGEGAGERAVEKYFLRYGSHHR
jgi:hypothetical protein